MPVNSALSSINFKNLCLFLACAVYALLGSPTPGALGAPEIVIMSFLLFAINPGALRDLFVLRQRDSGDVTGRVLLLYGLIICTITGMISGNNTASILRDVIPFLFLFLPLFFAPASASRNYNLHFLIAGVIVIGLGFSVRSLYGAAPEDLLYLENMPTVLFSALFLIGVGMQSLMHRSRLANVAFAVCVFAMSMLPLMAMAGAHQRASFGAAAIYIALILTMFFIKNQGRTIFVTGLVAGLWYCTGMPLAEMWPVMMEKTAAVGFNMRPQEMAAVWAVVTADPLTFLFGIGWGGHFHSPAVGGVNVNFTHNFFSSFLLKTGFCGMMLAGIYVVAFLAKLSQVIRVWPVLGIAIAAPVLIDLTLYASFKSFDFGLMLLMISWAGVYLRNSSIESSIAERQCADRLLCS